MKKCTFILLIFIFATAGCTLKQTPKDNENNYDTEITDKDSENVTDENTNDDTNDQIVINDDPTTNDDDGWGGDDNDNPPDGDDPFDDNNIKPDGNEFPDEDSNIEFTGTSFSYDYDGSIVEAEMTAMDGTNEIKFFKASKPSFSDGTVVIKFTNDFDEVMFSFSASELTSLSKITLDDTTNTSIWNRVKELYGSFTGSVTKTTFTKTGSTVTKMNISGKELKFKSKKPVDPENDDDIIIPDDNETPDFGPEDYSDFSFNQNSDSYSGFVKANNEGSLIRFEASTVATQIISGCPLDYCFSTTFSSAYGTINFRAAINGNSFPTTIDLENDGYSYLRWNTGNLQYGHFLGIIRVNDFAGNGFPFYDITAIDAGSDSIGFVKDAVNEDSDGDGTPNSEDECPYDPLKIELGICGCDIADSDSDFDDVPDCIDNCVNDYNVNQADLDSDGKGDICDSDIDGDGVLNGNDNCPYISNSNQRNIDHDSFGDLCDDDIDGDGVLNGSDNCPEVSNTDQLDTDGDGAGNVCETCPDDPAKTEPGVCGCNIADTDSDYDGFSDCIDNCPDIFNKSQLDSDNDDIGDVCDDTPFGG